MRHDIGVAIEQLDQVITVSSYLIRRASRHQGSGNIPGNDVFIAQHLLHAAHISLVEVADNGFLRHFSQVIQPLVVGAFDEQVAGDPFFVQPQHALFPERPVEFFELRPRHETIGAFV